MHYTSMNSQQLSQLTGKTHKEFIRRMKEELGTDAVASMATGTGHPYPGAARLSKYRQLNLAQTLYMLSLTNEHRRTVLKQVLGL